LSLFFNKTSDKDRTGGKEEEGRKSDGGRNDPNNVCTYINKFLKKYHQPQVLARMWGKRNPCTKYIYIYIQNSYKSSNV
jgi:hypothetical protein